MQLSRLPIRTINYIKDKLNEIKYKKIETEYNINSFKRIYFFHIRKACGISIIMPLNILIKS